MFEYIDTMPIDAFLSSTMIVYWVFDFVFGAYGE